jgi:hypothetical protein
MEMLKSMTVEMKTLKSDMAAMKDKSSSSSGGDDDHRACDAPGFQLASLTLMTESAGSNLLILVKPRSISPRFF